MRRRLNPRNIAVFSVFGLVALALVALASSLGLVEATDAALRRHYYALAPARDSAQRVVLVAADPQTVTQWGPPPYSAQQLESLASEIAAGEPLAIGVVGHERFTNAPPGDLDAIARQTELVIGNDLDTWSSVPAPVEIVRTPPGSSLNELIQKTALAPPTDATLPVHYLVPTKRLPVVPASRVASGDIPANTFRGKIVVIGVTAPSAVTPVQTPVGPLATAEVEAHALLGLSDGRVWKSPSNAMRWGICAALVFGLSLMLRRLSTRWAVLATVTTVMLVIGVDYALFVSGTIAWGVAGPALGLFLAAGGHFLDQQLHTARTLARITRQMAAQQERTSPAVDRVEDEALDAALWEDLADLGLQYSIEDATSMTAELSPGTWHLQIRAVRGTAESEIAEKRRDVRRNPFRGSYLTLRASWADYYLDPALQRRTLLVPIQHRRNLLGIWLLHVPAQVEVSPEEIARLEDLGHQMGTAVARRRNRDVVASAPQAGSNASLRDHVKVINHGIRLLQQEQRWATQIFEQLPFASLISTVWGEVEFRNEAMREQLDVLLSEDHQRDLRALLAILTHATLEQAHEMMRQVVRNGDELEFPGPSGRHVYTLTRIRFEEGSEMPGLRPTVSEHLLLIARGVAEPVRTPMLSSAE